MQLRSGVAFDDIECLDDGPVRLVVRAEIQRLEDLRDHAQIVRLVRASNESAQRVAERRTRRLPFFDEIAQRRLADDRKDDVAYDPVGVGERRIG